LCYGIDMPRIARVVLPGHPHHIVQRGVRSMDIFNSDIDRQHYLQILAEQSERKGLEFLAWCLMSNHVHLIAIPKTKEALAGTIGEAHRRYTRLINEWTGTRGYLFQGRFYSCPLDEQHTIAATRYTLRNPVRAKIVKDASEYPWSSARFHLGIVDRDPLVSDPSCAGLVTDWQSLLEQEPDEIGDIRKKLCTGWPCGNDRFLDHARAITGLALTKKPPGRPQNPGHNTDF